MKTTIHVLYTRSNPAHAWKFDRCAEAPVAALCAAVNEALGVETLVIEWDVFTNVPVFLDSAQERIIIR